MARRKELTIEAINQRLKDGKTGVTVMQRGDRLNLRATLPPRPGSTKKQSSQQIVSLKIYANLAGFEQAEAKALELSSLLAQQRFDWGMWDAPDAINQDSVSAWVERYRAHYLKQKSDDVDADYKWHQREWLYLKHLPRLQKLDADVITCAVARTKLGTRNRQLACQCLERFAKFAKIDVKLDELVGSYSPKRREIPTDEQIVSAIDRIPNPQWKTIAALMAVYGVRDHEAFLCTLKVVRGVLIAHVPEECKTDARSARPLHPEWVERLQLSSELDRPIVKGTRLKDYGNLTSRSFRRYDLGFTPYDLRHAWALRAVIFYKLPLPVVANMLGHSVAVLTATYNRWLRADQAEKIYEEMVLNRE